MIVVLPAILLGSYLLLRLLDGLWLGGRIGTPLSGRISLTLLFITTALGHFVQPESMAEMLPSSVPMRLGVIYVTGVLELAGAIGLLLPRVSGAAGWCLLIFLVLVFPANVYAALNHVPMGGHAAGPVYLLARAPLQLMFIVWTWWFAIRPDRARRDQPHSDQPRHAS